MKKVLFVIFFALTPFFLLGNQTILAQTVPNNKVGIHLLQPRVEDLEKTSALVNSQGGDWGYVTLVIQENDRDRAKWQDVFDDLRRLHLIPIVRLATNPEGPHWRRPAPEDAQAWVDFLDSLHWVVKNRYVILFNEPNHASEWGGSVDAKNYADVAQAFAEKFKEKNADFVVMLAGLDASAPQSPPFYQDEEQFLQTVVTEIKPDVFSSLFSGLSSHSYPNPAFAGNPMSSGRGTVRTYEWELGVLHDLGTTKDLPVFITETGWSAEKLSRDQIAQNYATAYQTVWGPDQRVVAVTPFVLNYQAEPFLPFSWQLYQSEDFYPQYYTVQALQKTKGEPVQYERGVIISDLPKELVAQSTYHFVLKLRNEGQGYWDSSGGYKLVIQDVPVDAAFFSDIHAIAPFEKGEVDFYLKTANDPGKYEARISLLKNNRSIINDAYWSFEVLPLPDMKFKVSLYPKDTARGDDFELQLFNERDELVFKRSGIKVKNGIGVVNRIQNIALGRKYRAVLLKPYYLPRQEIVTFQKVNNYVQFKELLPFDFNQDGALDFQDLQAVLIHPALLGILLPH